MKKKIITKDIRYPVNIQIEEKTLTSIGTFLVTKEIIKNLNETFSPMLFQKYMEKEYEERRKRFMDTI